MKIRRWIVGCAFLWPFCLSRAQLEPPNEAGVTMGQLHTIVRDVEASRRLWVTLGGESITIDGTDVIKIPGVFIFLTKGSPSGGTVGSSINHIGFIVPNNEEAVTKAKAAGFWAEYRNSVFGGTPQGWVFTPDDLKIRFNTDKSLNVPITNVLVMLYVPTSSVTRMQTWYAKMFGGKSGAAITNGFRVEGIPGVRLNVVTSEDERSYTPRGIGLIQGTPPAPDSALLKAATRPPLPTKGRTLDYIGFEIKNLEAFCKKLEGNGIMFDRPYRKEPHKSFASAELTDPWGVSIELTEGLNRF